MYVCIYVCVLSFRLSHTAWSQRCLSISRAETVAQLRVWELQVSSVGDRQWLYQTCAEFGYCEVTGPTLASKTYGLCCAQTSHLKVVRLIMLLLRHPNLIRHYSITALIILTISVLG